MKNIFYLFHNLIQSKDTRISLYKKLKSFFYFLISKLPFVLSLLFPAFIFYALYSTLISFTYTYIAIIISSLVSLILVVLISIPSIYFIKGINLFDIKKITEEIKKEKTKNKKYERLNETQIKNLKKLYYNNARIYFNTAEYDFGTFKNLIDKISIGNFNSKIYLNEEVKVKDFVAFIDELISITRFDCVDLCKLFKFYINDEFVDLNYNSVKVELSKYRKLTKSKN